jgi:hypothetical protein
MGRPSKIWFRKGTGCPWNLPLRVLPDAYSNGADSGAERCRLWCRTVLLVAIQLASFCATTAAERRTLCPKTDAARSAGSTPDRLFQTGDSVAHDLERRFPPSLWSQILKAWANQFFEAGGQRFRPKSSRGCLRPSDRPNECPACCKL